MERKIDYNCENLFALIPHFNEVENYNRKLLARHQKKALALQYKKQITICELFDEEEERIFDVVIKTICCLSIRVAKVG